ncbi:MAG: hypothetical protein R3222_02945 [Balneolaceae bacterium]|nr:hypothetical protein [Balneolaceae bacterium]
MRTSIPIAIILFSLGVYPFAHHGTVFGQHSSWNTPYHATLLEWEQRTLNFMLDRSHNFGGTNYNRGLFRRNITPMSPEHELDLMTYRFTLAEDYNWRSSDQAYRVMMGSLNATDFAVENQIKKKLHFDERHSLKIDGTHAENLRTERLMFQLSYEYRLPGNHNFGASHNLLNDKSDLDFTLHYRYGTPRKGMIYAGITFLDWAGNVVQGLADESANKYNNLYDETFEYQRTPKLFNVRLLSPTSEHFRLEAVGGMQTYFQKRVRQLAAADSADFIDEEWAHYAGLLAEYFNNRFTTGLTYQRRFSKLTRQPAPGSVYELDFNNYQYMDRWGFYFISRVHGPLKFDQWTWLERNRDRMEGERVPNDLAPHVFSGQRIPFNFLEYRLKIRNRLQWDPSDKGLMLGLEFLADYRYPQGPPDPTVRNQDFRKVYPTVREVNERMTFTIGYRVNSEFHFLAGISYDMDGDRISGIGLPRISGTPTWFDGGFGRLYVSW